MMSNYLINLVFLETIVMMISKLMKSQIKIRK
jgi:hypothetical protein